VIEQLRANTRKEGLIDPRQEQSAVETWWAVARNLQGSGLHHQAVAVALAWYETFCELQIADNERYHKGTSAHNSGFCYIALDEFTCGSWFFTLAFIEDVLTSGLAIPPNPATQALRVYFNRTDRELQDIASVALELKSASEQWQFPETIAVEVARRHRLGMVPFVGTAEVPLNRSFFRSALSRLAEGDANTKKQSLEFLASYLALTLPNVHIVPNATTLDYEVDLVVTQHTSTPTYLLEALGRSFLVECKNWQDPVGADVLNHFVAKMRFHRCRCGVLFSQQGLSGDKVPGRGLSYARLTQLRWYAQDECVVVVVTENHLKELAATGGGSFGALLLRGYESVRFSISETS
jgi:hypothetical protein